MEKEILDQLKAQGVDRPVMSYRMVGNRRIEVHCLGDDEPRQYKVEGLTAVLGETQGKGKNLKKLKVAELRKVAGDLGIETKGLRKADLITSIQHHK